MMARLIRTLQDCPQAFRPAALIIWEVWPPPCDSPHAGTARISTSKPHWHTWHFLPTRMAWQDALLLSTKHAFPRSLLSTTSTFVRSTTSPKIILILITHLGCWLTVSDLSGSLLPNACIMSCYKTSPEGLGSLDLANGLVELLILRSCRRSNWLLFPHGLCTYSLIIRPI